MPGNNKKNFMHITLLVGLVFAFLAIIALSAVCQTPFDILKNKTESFSEDIMLKASWREPWLNVIPRGTYPNGEGLTRTAFTMGRSEPTSDEEEWVQLQSVEDQGSTGACAVTYNQVYVGFHNRNYSPTVFGLVGPLMCQDEFAIGWKSVEFWTKYYRAIELRNTKSLVNRNGNVYRYMSHKASCNSSFTWHEGGTYNAGVGTIAAVPPAGPDMGFFNHDLPTSMVSQENLDNTAIQLMQEGAHDENTQGWITMGNDGPIFPLLIGIDASRRVREDNPDLAQSINASYNSLKDANPLLQRLGASLVLRNFRHVPNLFPARWKLGDSGLERVPTFINSTNSKYATKGRVPIINPDWEDPTVAEFESCEVLNPLVCTEEVLKPISAGMDWKPQNYFGEWKFVSGPDALLALDCAGNDPLHKQGAHFAEYRTAHHPHFPEYGRMILFRRCPNSFDEVPCS